MEERVDKLEDSIQELKKELYFLSKQLLLMMDKISELTEAKERLENKIENEIRRVSEDEEKMRKFCED